MGLDVQQGVPAFWGVRFEVQLHDIDLAPDLHPPLLGFRLAGFSMRFSWRGGQQGGRGSKPSKPE